MKSTILQYCSDFPEKPVSVLLWISGQAAFPSLRSAHLRAGLTPFHCWITQSHRRMQAYRTVISSSLLWTWEVKDMHQFKNRILRHFLCSWALSGVWCISTSAPGEGDSARSTSLMGPARLGFLTASSKLPAMPWEGIVNKLSSLWLSGSEVSLFSSRPVAHTILSRHCSSQGLTHPV